MEQCPKCSSVLRIGKTKMTFKHDDTPEKQTEAYTNMDMVCHNKTMHEGDEVIPCPNFGKVVKTISHKVN